MYKTYTIALLTFLAAAAPSSLHSSFIDIRPAFGHHENAYMEFVFVKGYKDEVNTLHKYLEYAAVATVGGALLHRIYSGSTPTVVTTTTSTAPVLTSPFTTAQQTYAEAYQKLLPAATPKNAAYAALAGIGAYAAYQGFEEYVDLQACINVLVKFLRDWPTNRAYTPEPYHALFDDLARVYNQKGITPFLTHSRDIVHGLQFIIKRTEAKVSDIYKKAFENEAAANYVVDAAQDVSTVLKALRDIIRF